MVCLVIFLKDSSFRFNTNVLDALNNKQCDFFIIEAAVLQNAIKKQLLSI